MNVRIRVIKTPPGFADEHIREAWIGAEMAAELDNGDSKSWSGNDNAGGYIVSGVDAVKALLEADKLEAARFWGNPVPPRDLRFRADCCEVISE